MPIAYELNIDHDIVEVAAWDLVSQGDIEEYLEEMAALPADLGKAILYVDFGEAADIHLSPLGALQIARSFEKLFDRGLRGCVIHAPGERRHETAKMMMSTFTSVCGDLPEGYCLTRAPLATKDVRGFLHGRSDQVHLVA